MKPKLIKQVREVTLKYKSQNDSFEFANKTTRKYPLVIINEAPWSINFQCYECGGDSRIFEYDPTIAIKTPVQAKFLRLVPCYSKFFDLNSLDSIADAFESIEILKNDDYTFLAQKNVPKESAFTKKTNLAYTRCEECSQEYLASYEFQYPDNDRKEKPDPIICEIHEIIQTDIYFEKDIDHYIKLRNLK